MNPSAKSTGIEWGFVAALIVLCGVLTALQYHWTGEVSRAEMTRLQAGLDELAQRMGDAFDAELAASCAELIPTAGEIDAVGREAAHAERVQRWTSGHPRPMFKRFAVASRGEAGLTLKSLDPRAAELAPLEWPAEWSDLKDDLARRLATPGGAPYVSRNGDLLTFAIFGGARARNGPNIGWLILELDLDYVRKVWLPELVRRYLQPDSASFTEVAVVTVATPPTTLYSTDATLVAGRSPQISVPFNRLGRNADRRAGPPASARWLLQIQRRPGALEAVVSASRQRNLAVAILVDLLILVAGGLLVRHTRRSRRLAEAQMNFVAGVSHELRTPLTVIRGAAHNLRRGVVQDPERVARYSDLILQHAEQLGAMVEQVLEFAGAQKNRPSSVREPVSIPDVLRDSLAAAAPDTEAAHCRVECQIPQSLPPVSGDAAALRRVFQNLVANAAKHGGAGGFVGLRAALVNGSGPPSIEVQIADRGPGIPESEQTNIFKPFVRGAAAQAAQVRGSGLGLSLASEIVKAHGGTISVRSRPGAGATFTVRLPAAPPSV